MQAATYLLACVAAPHRTSHPSQQKDAVHSCAPARGRWPAQAQDRCAAPHGWLRTAPVLRPLRRPPRHSSPTRHVPLQRQQGRRKGGHPVVSNRPLHRVMQQRCHHASASARSPSWPHMQLPQEHQQWTTHTQTMTYEWRDNDGVNHVTAWSKAAKNPTSSKYRSPK